VPGIRLPVGIFRDTEPLSSILILRASLTVGDFIEEVHAHIPSRNSADADADVILLGLNVSEGRVDVKANGLTDLTSRKDTRRAVRKLDGRGRVVLSLKDPSVSIGISQFATDGSGSRVVAAPGKALVCVYLRLLEWIGRHSDHKNRAVSQSKGLPTLVHPGDSAQRINHLHVVREGEGLVGLIDGHSRNQDSSRLALEDESIALAIAAQCQPANVLWSPAEVGGQSLEGRVRGPRSAVPLQQAETLVFADRILGFEPLGTRDPLGDSHGVDSCQGFRGILFGDDVSLLLFDSAGHFRNPNFNTSPIRCAGFQHLTQQSRHPQERNLSIYIVKSICYFVRMDAEIIEVVGLSCLRHGEDRLAEVWRIKTGDSQADLRMGVGFLGRGVSCDRQFRIIVRPVITVVEAPVPLVPDLPVTNPFLVATDNRRDEIGLTVQVVHGKGVDFLGTRRRSHQDRTDLDLVERSGFDQGIGTVPFPGSFRRLEVAPLGE